MRVKYTMPSKALITATVLTAISIIGLQAVPDRGADLPPRDGFALFPRQLGTWAQMGPPEYMDANTEAVLAADDYHQVNYSSTDFAAPVGLFMAYYADQSQNGVHSPEVCIPGSGWEIAWLERTDIADLMETDTKFMINRAIIQRGEDRMMVFYWFQQRERRVAFDLAAKFYLMVDGVTTGRTDGALIRFTTPIIRGESDDDAEARLMSMVHEVQRPLPRFIPGT